MKGLKFISVLLLISIGILIGHNLIPHHHHVAMINHPSSHECPEGDHEHPGDHAHPGNQEHHDGDQGGTYCHAFNDIHFVKYNTSQLPAPSDISSLMISADPGQVQDLQSCITSAIQAGKVPGILPAEYSGKLTLRGPPVLS